MNRKNTSLREIFLRMLKAGKKVVEIAQTLGVSRQTIHSWKKLDEIKLLTEPSKNTRKPPQKLEELREYITQNPFAFNREIAKALETNKSNIQRWRRRLGFKRKKAKTTYKEADPELKKSS